MLAQVAGYLLGRKRRPLLFGLVVALVLGLRSFAGSQSAIPLCPEAPAVAGGWSIGAFRGHSPMRLRPAGHTGPSAELCSINPVLWTGSVPALDETGRRAGEISHPTLLDLGPTWDLFAFFQAQTEAWDGRAKTLLAAARLAPDGAWVYEGIAAEMAGNVSAPSALTVPGASGAYIAAEGVLLYAEAEDLPYGWEEVAALPEGRDPVIVGHDGLLWLFVTRADGLHIFVAHEARGPYRPHAQNPVVARGWGSLHASAGAVLAWEGRLMRLARLPSGVAGALVTTLTPDEYEEEAVGALLPRRHAWDREQGRMAAVLRRDASGGEEWVALADGRP